MLNNKKRLFIILLVVIVVIAILLIFVIKKQWLKDMFSKEQLSKETETVSNIIDNPSNSAEITDEYLTQCYLGRVENNQYDEINVKLIAIVDISYDGYNKLVYSIISITKDGVTNEIPALMLLNREDDKYDAISCSSNFLSILIGLYKESINGDKVLEIATKHLEKNGIKAFQYELDEEIINDYTGLISLKKAREYVELYSHYNSTTLDYKFLYKKGTAKVKYLAFYEDGVAFNPYYPLDENTYNYMKNGDYAKQIALQKIERQYGSPYIIQKVYSVMDIQGKREIGSKRTIEEVKKWLDVETVEDVFNNNSSVSNEKEDKTKYKEGSNDNNKTDEDKAKDLAKKAYGTSEGVYFSIEQRIDNDKFQVSVRDVDTTYELKVYEVNIKTGSVNE